MWNSISCAVLLAIYVASPYKIPRLVLDADHHFTRTVLFYRGIDFQGTTVGLAKKFAMCTRNSGGVNQVCLANSFLSKQEGRHSSDSQS